MAKKIYSDAGQLASPKKSVRIVAIGASAGGLEAITELLTNLSPSTGLAFVYIQHLDPTHESMLTAILSRVTTMKVMQAQHLLPIEPDHLYIIPPNKDMEVIDGVLTLLPRRAKPFLHMPIDQFFISLAERQKEASVAILLSGTANDGTVGLKAIKTAGGITFAQDETAKFQSMPRSAMAEGVVDLVMPPAEIAKQVEQLSIQANKLESLMNNRPEDSVNNESEDLKTIIDLLKKSVGVDFNHYKSNTIKRRILRRMLLFKQESLKDYARYLRQHTSEINTLYNDLLINVTSFFRDAEALKYLKETLVPRLLKEKPSNAPIRVWVPACSTGEEVYSLAMIFLEVLGDRATSVAIQIFATDLSENAIAKARLGTYSRNELMDVSPNRLQRFFTKVDNNYRIVKSIRDLCVFAPHNIFKDPPFSRLDLISCCNLLIYLDTVLQKKVMATFHYALNETGYLILGKSETVGSSTQLFSQVEPKVKIYTRRPGSSRSAFEMNYRIPEQLRREVALEKPKPVAQAAGSAGDLDNIVDQLMLSQYTPASVVVNQDLDIIQFRGATGLFLEPAPGRASLNLLKMARPGLGFELRNAIHKVKRLGQPVKKSNLEFKSRTALHQISIEVVPLLNEPDEQLYLVIFEELSPGMSTESGPVKGRDRRIKQLEEELAAVREDMRSIAEAQEASNEELQSANEEIVSSNEELQSINEELETSKEEVESANEELMTINQELQVRNEQLSEMQDYSDVVFTTIREAVLVLDQHLRVRMANPTFYQTFRLTEEETEGRLIYELRNREWDIPQIRELLIKVISTKEQVFGFEIKHEFSDIGEKVMLLNVRCLTQDVHRRQLVFLAIEDITEHRQAERVLVESEAWFRSMADNAPVMIWVAGADRTWHFFNKTWLEFTGHTMEQETGTGWSEGIHPDDLELCLAVFYTNFDQRNPFQLEYRRQRHDGQYRWVLDVAKPNYSPAGDFTGYVGTCTDIHTQRTLNEELDFRVQERTQALVEVNTYLEQSNSELQQFAYVASHDLQEPLRKIMIFSERLQEQHQQDLPPSGRDYVDKITISAQRMSRLIDDLLNFSRISRQETNISKIDLDGLVRNVLIDFDLTIAETKATVNYHGLPVVQASPVQLTHLFHNLVSNAFKFASDARPLVVTISHGEPDAEEVKKYLGDDNPRNYHKITVADNGIGFQPEFADQIFVIFQRLHDKNDYAGTGIGLALCRRIAQNHGGTIYAESQPNEGASFHVLLPKRKQ